MREVRYMFQHWRGADHNKCTGVKMLIVIQDPRFYLVHKYQGLLTFIFLYFSAAVTLCTIILFTLVSVSGIVEKQTNWFLISLASLCYSVSHLAECFPEKNNG